jgi:ABC-type polysaccharide/polyol phosphate transport system ATPase subunit
MPESENSVKIDDINLVFPVGLYREESFRKKIISFVQSPAKTVFSKKPTLHVIKNVSLTAQKGDRIAIIGKNGAGKSTLCRLISGVYKPQSGKISVQGEIKSILDPGACVFPELSGRENARILLKLMNLNRTFDIEKTLADVLEFSGLGHFADMPMRLYSTGMYTRLCLAIVTAQPADILILDEVLDGADLEFSKLINRRILEVVTNANIVFFVSHSIESLRTVCNKGAVLHNGQIQYFGPIEEAIQHYLQIPGAKLGHDQ